MSANDESRFYVRLTKEFEDRWGYPAGPWLSIEEAMDTADSLRVKVPTIPMRIVRRDESGDEVDIIDIPTMKCYIVNIHNIQSYEIYAADEKTAKQWVQEGSGDCMAEWVDSIEVSCYEDDS